MPDIEARGAWLRGRGHACRGAGARALARPRGAGRAIMVMSGLGMLLLASAALAQPELHSGSAQDSYDQAFGLLRQRDYAAAAQAFHDFVASYPDDGLAGNAQYWLGETYFVRGDFENAAAAFDYGYRLYPQGGKAAENLVKLAMSLGKVGRAAEACTLLDRLGGEFPGAPASIVERAKSERQGLGCVRLERGAAPPVRVSVEAEAPAGWHLAKVPVLCARYASLAEGMQAMMADDIEGAARAGCFKMKPSLPVRLVGEYDHGHIAKITYQGQRGDLRTAWTLRAFVEEDGGPSPGPRLAEHDPARR
jgi:tol-pal system protein YbgF